MLLNSDSAVVNLELNEPLSVFKFVTLVEKLPESAFKFVTRVENEPLSVTKLVNLVDILALGAKKEPLISVAI